MNEPLKDWKTILGLLIITLISASLKLEWITPEMAGWMRDAALLFTGVSARVAIKKAQPK